MFTRKKYHFNCGICRKKYQEALMKMSQQQQLFPTMPPREKTLKNFVTQKYPKIDPCPPLRREIAAQKVHPPVLRRNATAITFVSGVSIDTDSIGDTLQSAGFESINQVKTLTTKIAKEIKTSHDDNKVLSLMMNKLNDALNKHTEELITKTQSKNNPEMGTQTEVNVVFVDDKLLDIEEEVKRIHSCEAAIEDNLKKSQENDEQKYKKLEEVCIDLKASVISEINNCKAQITNLSTQMLDAKATESVSTEEISKNRVLAERCSRLQQDITDLNEKIALKEKTESSQSDELNLKLKRSEDSLGDMRKQISELEKKLMLSQMENKKLSIFLQVRENHFTDMKKEFFEIGNMAETLLCEKQKKDFPKKSNSAYSICSKSDFTSYATSMTSILNMDDLDARLEDISVREEPQNVGKRFATATNSELSFDLMSEDNESRGPLSSSSSKLFAKQN